MPSKLLTFALLMMTLSRVTADQIVIREQASKEKNPFDTQNLSAGEMARDYSVYFNKTLWELGVFDELVVWKAEKADVLPGKSEPARPTDSVIKGAVHDFVLQPFSQYATYTDYMLPQRRKV